MGIPKSFNFLGCSEVTLILRDYKTLTGKIISDFDDRKYKEHKDEDDCKKEDDYKKDKDECCKPAKVDVKVDVDDKCDFILLELTREASSVSLQEIDFDEDDEELEIEWVNVEFRRGTCVAVNVCDIIYAGVNAEIDDQDFEIEFDLDLAAAAEAETTK